MQTHQNAIFGQLRKEPSCRSNKKRKQDKKNIDEKPKPSKASTSSADKRQPADEDELQESWSSPDTDMEEDVFQWLTACKGASY